MLAPKYQSEVFDIPTEWSKVTVNTQPLYTDWWKRFKDPVLTALIEEALKYNANLAESMAKVDAAAAKAGGATSQLAPTLSADGATNNTHSTQNNRTDTSYNGKLSAAWELDFWGKFRSQRTYLTNVLMNTVLSHEALRLSVASQTAQSYFALLALDMQLATVTQTLETRVNSLSIYTNRYNLGDITELDLLRAKAEVNTVRYEQQGILIKISEAESSLSILLGRSPREIMSSPVERGSAIETLPSPPVLPEGLPSDLLLRRPDVRASEFLIMASNASIGEARAEYFPSISITGMLGTASSVFTNIFLHSDVNTWDYGGTVSLPLLNFGRTWYKLKDAEAQKRAAIEAYRYAVASAFSDVRKALTNQQRATSMVDISLSQVDILRKAASIARFKYDNGASEYLSVLDAQRELLMAELTLSDALRNRLNAVVSMCMALGGGWKDPGVEPGPIFIDVKNLLEAQDKAGSLSLEHPINTLPTTTIDQ